MFLLIASLAQAATVQLEVDPAPFALSGYAVHARMALPDSPWTIGAGSYSMELPDMMVAMAPDNRDEGWSARIKPSVGVFVDRYKEVAADGRHLGVQVAVHRWEVGRDGETDDLTSILVMPRIGYVWTPFDDLGLYLDPWFGAGGTVPISDAAVASGETYQHFPVMVFGAVHVGWRLGS